MEIAKCTETKTVTVKTVHVVLSTEEAAILYQVMRVVKDCFDRDRLFLDGYEEPFVENLIKELERK